jgi:hypothetical protein
VLIIAGILTFVGFEYMPDNTLISDYEVLKQTILQKRFNALGYSYVGEDNLTCIEFNTTWLNEDENLSKVKYFFKSDIYSKDVQKICFDYMGRDFNGSVDENLTNLIHIPIIITLDYRGEEKNITIYPITGAVK